VIEALGRGIVGGCQGIFRLAKRDVFGENPQASQEREISFSIDQCTFFF